MKNLIVSEYSEKISKLKIHSLVKSISRKLGFKISNLEINFLSGDEIQTLNKKYLKHDYKTDIITFSYSVLPNLIDGEIFISLEDAKNNADRYKVSYNEEIVRLIIHGLLHLIGFNDKLKKDRIKMKALENSLVLNYKSVL